MTPTPSPPRRRALQAGGALVLAFAAAGLAQARTVVAVRVWPAEAYTRLTLESERALQARTQYLAASRQLLVDIDELELDATLRELVGRIRPDDPFIAALRVEQPRARQVRLVIDLRQPVRPQAFALDPVAAFRHRYIVDLHPAVEPDPLLALLRRKELAAGGPAREAAGDPLGELIDRIGARGDAPPTVVATAPAPPTPPATARDLAAAPAPAPARPASTTARRAAVRPLRIVVDPGHGGEDPGAIGPSGLREKDVVLAIALKLRRRLERNRGMAVVLTRDADFFVPLRERVRLARRVEADLLLSVHADAFIRPQANGASVFALSTRGATSATARWMAQRENASDLVGGIDLRLDDAQLMRTLLDMSTTAQIRDSLRVGREVLAQMDRVGDLHKPQVEQAGFAVLKAPDVPSILVETAFISNPQDEQRLRDERHQRRIVEALATGVERYFARRPARARTA
jgi:N-acetylmuramoyl-L-alanine amidase